MAEKSAVIYARFSCSKQREASIEDQLRVCREWCQREGYAVVAEYSDHAMSGKTDERPEFQRMIANAGESDIVLVYMMDRFSRDAFDAPIYKRELAKHGVRLVSAIESIPDSPEGIIYEKLLEGLAACESAKTSVRTRRGMEGNALKCKTNGVPVYGYRKTKDDTYEVDEGQAAYVREAFARVLAHEPVSSIATDFARRGVRSSTGRPCCYSMVYGMVRNEKYTGVYKFGDVRVEGGMPSIVDAATFKRAQRVKPRKQRKKESWGRFVLAGRVICAGCGKNMQGVSGRGRHNVKYEYYACPDKCVHNVRRDWLESSIATVLRELLRDRQEAVGVAQALVDAKVDETAAKRRKEAEKAAHEAERAMSNLMRGIEMGVIVPGTKERIAELQDQRDRAQAEMRLIEGQRLDPERLADFLQAADGLTDEQLVDAFVWQAVVSDEDVLVVLNYDKKKSEPARLEVSRVRTDLTWLPSSKSPRIRMACSEGLLFLLFAKNGPSA